MDWVWKMKDKSRVTHTVWTLASCRKSTVEGKIFLKKILKKLDLKIPIKYPRRNHKSHFNIDETHMLFASEEG